MIGSITFWASAFIPRDIPQVTSAVTVGVHRGKTKISDPLGLWYLTDQRTFDSNSAASSRMHHLLKITVTGPVLSARIVNDIRRCDPTMELRPSDGSVTCQKRASTDRIRSTPLVLSGNTVSFRLEAEASNSCFRGAPDIDWKLQVTVAFAAGLNLATVKVDGLVEPFPAFECYARADNGPVLTLFRVGPNPGSSPWNLLGDANKRVTGQVTFSG